MFLRLYPAQIPAIRRLLDTFDVWLVLQHFVGFGIHFNAIPCHFITKTKTASTTTTQPTNSRFISLVFLHFCLIFFFGQFFVSFSCIWCLVCLFLLSSSISHTPTNTITITWRVYQHLVISTRGVRFCRLLNIITLNMRNPISCYCRTVFLLTI